MVASHLLLSTLLIVAERSAALHGTPFIHGEMPEDRGYRVKEGDTWQSIADSLHVDVQVLLHVNAATMETKIDPLSLLNVPLCRDHKCPSLFEGGCGACNGCPTSLGCQCECNKATSECLCGDPIWPFGEEYPKTFFGTKEKKWTSRSHPVVRSQKLLNEIERLDIANGSYVPADDKEEGCEKHEDCPSIGPLCMKGGGWTQKGGFCTQCHECHWCADGIDGTCSGCGPNYPLNEPAEVCGTSKAQQMFNVERQQVMTAPLAENP